MPTLRKGRGTGATPGQQAQDDPSFDPGSGSEEEEEEPTEPSARGGSELEETISAALKPLMDRLRALEDRRDTPEEVELVSEDKGDPKGGEGDDPSGSDGDGDSSGGVAPDDGDVGGEDEDEEYSPYAAANPYERPLAQLQVPAPHLWELSDTPGCQDYKIALRDKDRAVHELKMLHAVLSYLHDAIEDLGGLLGARADGGGTQLRRIFRTLDGVFDLAERRRAEVEVMMNARSTTATEEDKAVADYIRNRSRGFAGGVVVRHKGVADEIESFIKEAQNSRLKQLAKLSVVKPGKPGKPGTGKEDNPNPNDEGGGLKGTRRNG